MTHIHIATWKERMKKETRTHTYTKKNTSCNAYVWNYFCFFFLLFFISLVLLLISCTSIDHKVSLFLKRWIRPHLCVKKRFLYFVSSFFSSVCSLSFHFRQSEFNWIESRPKFWAEFSKIRTHTHTYIQLNNKIINRIFMIFLGFFALTFFLFIYFSWFSRSYFTVHRVTHTHDHFCWVCFLFCFC